MAAHEVCDEVADDSVGGALSFCDDPGHQGLCGGVPFEVDSAVDVGVCAVELCPAGASARGLLAGDGEIVFLQALVVGDGFAEAAATIAGYLDNALHVLFHTLCFVGRLSYYVQGRRYTVRRRLSMEMTAADDSTAFQKWLDYEKNG